MTTLAHTPSLSDFTGARRKPSLLHRVLAAVIEGRQRKAADFTRAYLQSRPWLEQQLAGQKPTRQPSNAA